MNTRFIALLTLAVFAFPPLSFAATNSWSASVNVPDHCTVTDTDGVLHEYVGHYLGICALQAAIDDGLVSGVHLSNAFPSFGLFVTGVSGVAANPSSEYWALYQNGGYASAGLTQLPLAAGDTLVLELHDFSDTFLDNRLTITVSSLVSSTPAPTASGGGLSLHKPFDVPAAISFIWSKQGPSGTFGSSLIDDWVAIATAGGNAGDMRARIAAYNFAHPPALSSVTDYERHAMALEALGVNPYLGPTDYITPIIEAFDGTQIGDASQDNDDIFALFPLMHAGYSADDEVIAKTVAFIISRQRADGSWDGSIDMTAAAIQALALTPSLPQVVEATEKALAYLHAAQGKDGGFRDVSATSWVLQAAAALGQSPFAWNAGTYQMPDYYLATKQEVDGGIGPIGDETAKRVWQTAYAIPAIEHKSWDTLLQHFSKPALNPLVLGASTSTVATDASATATTSPASQKPTVYIALAPQASSAQTATSSQEKQSVIVTVSFSWTDKVFSTIVPWFF
ncbi:hypothetical protein HY418_01615 [Candidatus Kaiserbacteria bacterium]|nr:hypothetical protein [Candidatus Kaiserbacteria bacterium]